MKLKQRLARSSYGNRIISLLLTSVFVLLSFASGIYTYTRVGTPVRAYAATSSNLNYQARLLQANGNVVPDGNYHIEFKLYDGGTQGGPGGTGEANAGTLLWTETRSTGNLVRVVNGYFSVNLGSVTAFPGTIAWDQELWLTTNIGGSGGSPSWDGEMLAPSNKRTKLTAVPYSFRSSLADALKDGGNSLTAADLLHKAPASPQSFNSSVAGLRINQVGSGGLIQLQGDGVDIFTVNKVGDGYFKGALDVDAAFTAGSGNALSINASGDITSAFTALNGTSTTNGAAVLASTSLTLNDASGFDVGNYVQVNSANCGGTGVNPCYSKITAKVTNTLTITPSLTWANGSTVNEYHIPEIGGTNTAQTLANRYGRGYFIAGVAAGNGTTYYNEGDITTSLDTFDLLNTGVATLNIGGESTTINIGAAGTTVSLPGALSVQGATLDIGTATQAGGLVIQNGSAKTGTIVVGTLAANRTYTLPDADGTICLTTTCTGGGGPSDAFVKDGNNFGVTTVLGTNDNFGLAFETNATQRVLIDASGNVGIGTSGTPSQLLSVGGTTGNFTVDSSGAVSAVGLSSSSGLVITAGGASITGGLNNNGGGITNAGSITGVGTDITALAGLTIASGGTSDLTLNSASAKVVLGATTLQTAGNLLLDLANAVDTGLSLQNSGSGISNLNLVDGGLQTGGTLRLTNAGALQNITGLTVSSGDALFNGNVTIGDTASDRLTINSHILGANGLVFQGATDDGFATTIVVTDPTANNTITLPDGSGTLVLDTRSITTAAGSGLTGGGDLSANRGLSLDINGITTKTYVNPDDFLAIYDSTTAATRKISRSDFLQGVVGALQYRGTWDASTNTPSLQDGTGTSGDMYIVSTAGSQNFGQGPSISFLAGDWALYNGSAWEKVDQSAKVTSIFGRTGAIVAQSGDYSGLQITNTPAGTIASTNVQAALNELANEKLGSLNGLTAITQTFANDTNVTLTSAGSTHTLGWAGLLTVARGGTGAGTFTTNGILYGNGTGALQDTAAGTGGQLLLADASGVPTFTTMSGDVTISSAGLATIGANTINLTTDTVGNYVANLGALTGLTTTGNTGEGSTPTLAVTYGSLANTSVQGNTGLTITAGTNLSGGGAITLGTGGTVTLNLIPNPTFSTSVTTPLLTSAAGLSITSGGAGDITLDSASNKLIIGASDTTLERTAAGSYTIDLKDNALTSLVLSNSSAGGSSFANLNLADGELQIAGVSVLTSGRALQNLTSITNGGLFTSSGGDINLNVSSNFATNINTGTSTGTVSIGGGSAPLVINSTNFDVSAAGVLSGITGYTQASGNFAISGTGTFGTGTGAISLNGATSVTGTNTFTVGTGTATFGGLIAANGSFTLQTGDTFTINGEGITDLTGNGLILSGTTVAVDATTSGTTAVTSLNSGIEVTAAGVRLLGGCANTQILKWTTAGGGAWACAADATGISDSRAKQNIQTVEGTMLDKIKDIRIVEFDYNCESPAFGYQYCDTTHQTGVIAQELAQIFPELVVQDEHGYYSVRYDALAVYNLKAVGELAQKIKSNGDASLNNVTAQSLTVNGVLEAGTIRADHIEGLDYLGRIDSIEARVDTTEQRLAAVENNQNLNLDLSNLTVGKLTATEDVSVQNLTVNLDLIAKGSMIVEGSATFKEAVRFEKNLLLEGEINVLGYANVQGLTVNLDLIVKGAMVIDGKATFKEAVRFEKDVVFEKDVAVKGQTTFNKDTAGYVTIKQGEVTAKVTFTTAKARKPVIAVTLGEGKFAQYSYRNVTEEGFEIILLTPAVEDLSFSWVAIQTEEVAEAPAP